MPDLKTSITLNEIDQIMINDLGPVAGEKTMTGLQRYALRELYRKFFGDQALQDLHKKTLNK